MPNTASTKQYNKNVAPKNQPTGSKCAIFTSVVLGAYPINNAVKIKDEAGVEQMAIVTSSIFSQMLGLNICYFPEAGTEVIVLSTGNSRQQFYVIASIPSAEKSIDKTLVETNYTGVDKSELFEGQSSEKRRALEESGPSRSVGCYSSTMVDGEAVFGTKTGPSIEFLLNLIRLKGSDLATIEAYVLDDLVRIISRNFEQFSAFGDFKIINSGGGLNVVWNGTSNEVEAFGGTQQGEPLEGYEQVSKNNLKVDSKEASVFSEDMRWRFTNYVGKIGNFIHLFITDPGKTLMSENPEYKAGRFRYHINQDGTLLVQSISEIAFEKVVRIPVPIAKDRIDALKADAEKHLDAYKVWTPLENEELYETSYKLKDYAKWLSNYYAFAGFYLNDIFNIPSEEESNDPDPYCGDTDFQSENSGGQYSEQFNKMLMSYATIRIFKDGSIMLYDAYGSAVHMAGGNVSISAAKSINLEASENINITAGRDVIVNAANNIELSALLKGILLKAKTWLEAFCSKGPVIIESSMTKDQSASDGLAEGETPDPEYEKRLKNANGSGIIATTSHSNNPTPEKAADISIRTPSTIFMDGYYYANRCKMVLFDLMRGAGQFVVSNAISVANRVLKFTGAKVMAPLFYARAIYTKQNKPAVFMGSQQETLVNYDPTDDNYPKMGEGFDASGANETDATVMKGYSYDNKTHGWNNTSNAQFSYRDSLFYNTDLNSGKNKLFTSMSYMNIADLSEEEAADYALLTTSELWKDLTSSPNRNVPYPGMSAVINTYVPTIKSVNNPIEAKGEALLQNNKAISPTQNFSIYQYKPKAFR